MMYGLTEDSLFLNSKRKFYQTLGGSLVHLLITLYESLYFGYQWPWYLYLMVLVSFLSVCYNIGQRLGLQIFIIERKRRLGVERIDLDRERKK